MDLTNELREDYRRLWDSCAVRPARLAAADAIADRVAASRARYEAAGRPAGVPWHVVGAIHMLESSGSFETHLHNGDPLSARTVHVPAGRPPTGKPPFSWEESAADALAQQGLQRWRDWSIEGTLYVLERYNGFGYRSRAINSPYLWSFSNHYSKGKFVADGRFSPTAVSAQCGAAVILRRLVERELTEIPETASNAAPPADDGILRRGAKGAKVVALKAKLRAWFETTSPGEWERLRIGDNPVFGASLERAVKRFQGRVGLLADGEVGPSTRRALARKPKPVEPFALPPDAVYPGPLANGATGQSVRLVQGWLSLGGLQVAIDGDFGPATERAVRAFQRRRKLPVTGVVDEATHAALVAPLLSVLAPITGPKRLAPLVAAYARRHLRGHPREIGGQNSGPWVRLYTDGQEGAAFPWCAGFATFVVDQAATTLGVASPLPRTLSCDAMADGAGPRLVTGSTPGAQSRLRPGSIFLQLARGSERRRFRYRHTGIILEASPSTMTTIEGNTNDDGSAEGYEVCRRVRGYADMDFIVL